MFTLDLAGWRVRLACRPAGLAEAVAARYAAFATAAAPHLVAHVGAQEAGWRSEIAIPLRGTQAVCNLQSAICNPSLLDASLRRDGDIFLFDAAGVCGKINLTDGTATLTPSTVLRAGLGSATPLADLEYFVRVLYALLAEREGGLLIHAAGLLVGGQAHLFVGQSGSGKSTVAALSPHATVLNDDLILLRSEGAGWTAYGTPFWNAETLDRGGQTAHGPLTGIYKLVQDREVYLESLSPAAAAAELVANCPVVNGDPELLPGLLARCRALAGTVPVQRLHFRKAPDFWGALGCTSTSSGR
jgi:hypothetical protein